MKEETVPGTAVLDWQESENCGRGARIKVLSGGSGDAPRVLLPRVEPGWSMDPRPHVLPELHSVLERFLPQRGRGLPGRGPRAIPAHAEHGPFSTDEGATILVTWCRPAL